MGEDKALVRVDGVALAKRVADVLAQAGCTPVTLVGRQPTLAALGLPVLTESADDHHPLWGVSAALESLSAPLALFAPCDLIQLDVRALTSLLAAGGPCVAQGPERIHPLLCVLPRELSASARLIAEQGGSAHSLVAELPRVPIAAEALWDANRPVDLPQPAE